MANSTELAKVRIKLCAKPENGENCWTGNEVLLAGEIGINTTTNKFKIGNNASKWSELKYVNLGDDPENEILTLIQNENGSLRAEIINLINNNSSNITLDIKEGSTNGTIQYSINGTDFTEVKVKGLASAAYQSVGSSVNNVPQIGVAISNKANYPILADASGKIKPGTAALGNMAYETKSNYATKNDIKGLISANDAMSFKGIISSTKALPTANVINGDTYKVAEKGSYNGKDCEIGDMFIALVSGSTITWEYVPSGNESSISTDLLTQGQKTLILNGNFS